MLSADALDDILDLPRPLTDRFAVHLPDWESALTSLLNARNMLTASPSLPCSTAVMALLSFTVREFVRPLPSPCALMELIR
jgi:hypothetical protein